MKSVLLTTFFLAFGLCACGEEDLSGDFNVTGHENSGEVDCEDVCRYVGTYCSDEDYDYPCRNAQDLYKACKLICTESGSKPNSSVIFDLMQEDSCWTTNAFLGVTCRVRD